MKAPIIDAWYLVPALVAALLGLGPSLADADAPKILKKGSGEREVLFLGPGAWHGPSTYLGVRTVELTPELRAHFGVPEDRGVMVSWLQEDGPAERAGVRVGDILATLDGEGVASTRDILGRLRDREPGESVVVELWRDGRLEQLGVVLDERPRGLGWRALHRWPGPELAPNLEELERRLELQREALEASGLSEEQLERFEVRLRENLETLEKKLNDPELHGRLRMIHVERGKLEERVRELEQRIQQLERELTRERSER